MKKRIIISVTSDLATDQRVLKSAFSCHKNGYDVLLAGRKLKNSLPLNLPFKYLRFRLIFNSSAFFYAEYNIRLFFFLLFSRCDILLSNDTDTLPANYLVSQLRRKKLVFDAHELFPEVPELARRPCVKKIWEKLEDFIFPRLQYSYTVCQSIAGYYNRKYGIEMKVVRNVPYYRQTTSRLLREQFPGKKIVLYQGALNVGRGLEWVIDAMPLIDNAVLVIIGCGDIRQQLETQVERLKLKDKVFFAGKIGGDKLHEYTSSADIGLCLLESRGLSYYYSLPNRIFDYIQAGLPVLATCFPEIENIVATCKTGVLIDRYEADFIAATINDMLNNPLDTSHFGDLAKEFCWENEEKILMGIISPLNPP
ncbi:MAG: glycosyltransferase [Prevotellaceae bacterium]|jgi:glycosyltransferase involved in cell wall biosynthesis|nr:glycosyltransferase [Prevotellaceae bacterium]